MRQLISGDSERRELGYKTMFKRIIIVGIVFITMITGISFVACGSPLPLDADIAHLRAQIKENPENGDLYIDLAQLLNEKNDNEGALFELNKALDIHPKYPRALLYKGYVYMQMQEYDLALEPLLDLLEATKDEEMAMLSVEVQTAHYYLGESYHKLDKYNDAISHLLTALTIDGSDADAHHLLGIVYYDATQYEEAVIEFERAVLFVPNYTEAYQGMYDVYMALNLPAYANYAVAMMNFSEKRYKQSISELQAVLLEITDSDAVYLGLGLSYEGAGQILLAFDAYERALQLNPDNWLANGRYLALQAGGL